MQKINLRWVGFEPTIVKKLNFWIKICSECPLLVFSLSLSLSFQPHTQATDYSIDECLSYLYSKLKHVWKVAESLRKLSEST